MTSSKLELNLSEENDIGFSLKIIGSDKDLGLSKPKIRFTITEASTGRGWIFNAFKRSDEDNKDGVHVTIPNMKSYGIMEGEKYDGKLEVILGTRLFTPTEVDVTFVEPLKIEAVLETSKKSLQKNTDKTLVKEGEEEFFVESEIDSIIKNKSQQRNIVKEEVVFKPTQVSPPSVVNPVSYKDLSDKEKKVVNTIFVAECKKLGVYDPKTELLEGSDYTKKRLQVLIAKATRRVIDKR